MQKMEAFRLEQEIAEAARLDAQQTRMLREEKEKMHREQQKAKVFFGYNYSLCICCIVITIFELWQTDHGDIVLPCSCSLLLVSVGIVSIYLPHLCGMTFHQN